MYTAVLLPPAGKRHRQGWWSHTPVSHAPAAYSSPTASANRFLIDTGYEVCVVPRRLAPGHRGRISYDLFTANGTPIPTYGWHQFTHNLGLRRDFTLRFVVADVEIPISGADFLANFSLLVDSLQQQAHGRGHVPIDISLGGIHIVPKYKDHPDRRAGRQTLRRNSRSHSTLGGPVRGVQKHGVPHQNDIWPTSVLSTPSPRTGPTDDSQSRVQRYAERRHGASLGWSLVVSTEPRSQ